MEGVLIAKGEGESPFAAEEDAIEDFVERYSSVDCTVSSTEPAEHSQYKGLIQ